MDYTDNTALINAIKDLLKAKGIKQQFIADSLHISKSQMSQLLSGRKKLDFEDVNKILNCFDYKLDINFIPKSDE